MRVTGFKYFSIALLFFELLKQYQMVSLIHLHRVVGPKVLKMSTFAEIHSPSVAISRSVLDIKQHQFSVAPMMEYTDRHQRYLYRLLSAESVLYTEMIGASTLTHTTEFSRYLEAMFDMEEPLVLQLGGSDPTQMQSAARIAHDFGYQEININCGCPSEKVAGNGCFGAALMRRPDLVSELALRVGTELNKPATIKCRIGVDDNDSYEELVHFIGCVSEKAKVNHFIIHARKAVLNAKFSPADNRKIPPLKYDFVYKLVKDFPNLSFTLNGGVLNYEDVELHLQQGVAGVMVGRAVVDSPFYWKQVDSKVYGKPDSDLSRREILQDYLTYAQRVEDTQGKKARRALIKPLFGLFTGEYMGRVFRSSLDALIKGDVMPVGIVIEKAAAVLPADVLDLRASSPPIPPHSPRSSSLPIAVEALS